MNIFPFQKSTRKIFDKFSQSRRRPVKDFGRPKNLTSHAKAHRVMNFKCLKDTFKSGTIERVSRANQSVASETGGARRAPEAGEPCANLCFGDQPDAPVQAKALRARRAKAQTLGGSVTKEKNTAKPAHFQQRESAPPKSVFELFPSKDRSEKENQAPPGNAEPESVKAHTKASASG